MSRPVIECKYGCGTLLQNFNEEANKYYEYQTTITHTAERCQSIKPRGGGGRQAPSLRPSFENPIQKAVEQPHQTKEEMIAEAQRIRKEENDNLIEAIKALTVEIAALARAVEIRNESLP